jgi:hypothetical protein
MIPTYLIAACERALPSPGRPYIHAGFDLPTRCRYRGMWHSRLRAYLPYLHRPVTASVAAGTRQAIP